MIRSPVTKSKGNEPAMKEASRKIRGIKIVSETRLNSPIITTTWSFSLPTMYANTLNAKRSLNAVITIMRRTKGVLYPRREKYVLCREIPKSIV
jgi:hypothetical protein